ncbi:MAG TPA: DUF3443 family protein [Burkholderiaceae bacterium]|nr:DUF3443 family protein [Burkholderiaceae bacterium]
MDTLANPPRKPCACLAALLLTLAGCGGGGNSSSTAGTGTPDVNDYASVIVDSGPPQVNAVNSLYTTVTVCAPGSSTQCQTIDHVLVDTGSSGFRVLASALGGGLTSAQLNAETDANGNVIVECTQFVDGYSWGPVKTATVQVGGETASNVPIQVIGDPAYPSSLIPSSCVNVPNGEEDTVAQFGANGVLGIGNYLRDCGDFCTQAGVQDGSDYNACSTTAPVTCVPAAVDAASQVANPAALFATDNNGVLIQFSPVGDADLTSATGLLVFGINTQNNNSLGSATVYALDPGYGTFQTSFDGVNLTQSYLDTGSNGYYLPDSSIPLCTGAAGFYCPATPLGFSAQIQDTDGDIVAVPFTVASADSVPAGDAVAPDLAGPTGTDAQQTFDWGLPFFYGRNVYVIFEGSSVGNKTGPAVAF